MRSMGILLLLLLVAVAPLAIVICQCQDGQIVIELAFHRCCSISSSAQGLGVTSASDAESDDPCQDVPFSIVAKPDAQDELAETEANHSLTTTLGTARLARTDLLPETHATALADRSGFCTPLEVVVLRL